MIWAWPRKTSCPTGYGRPAPEVGCVKIASITRQLEKAKADIDIRTSGWRTWKSARRPTGLIYLNNFSQGWINAKPFKVGATSGPAALSPNFRISRLFI